MNIAYRAGRWSSAHWKTATFVWLAVVIFATIGGRLVGTVNLTDAEQGTGQSAVARRRRDGPLERLTPREREVLGLMAEGRSNTGIAESLVLTTGAVEKHIQSILSKLDLPQSSTDHRRVLAVLAYLQSEE